MGPIVDLDGAKHDDVWVAEDRGLGGGDVDLVELASDELAVGGDEATDRIVAVSVATLGPLARLLPIGYVGARFEDVTERCLLYTSPSPRDGLLSRMPSSA